MWYYFCCKCGEENELEFTFMHEADGELLVCPDCNFEQIAEYDEDIETGDGYITTKPNTACSRPPLA